MLQALIFNKLDRWLSNKNPWEIEDLLTSIVFGSCKYAGIDGWKYGLRPFLAAAINGDNRIIAHVLDEKLPVNDDILTIEYEFWPSFSKFSSEEQYNDAVIIEAAIPELILTIITKNSLKYFVLVEVKLNIGKSSTPSSDLLRVGDQLAKYWHHLKKYASEREGEAIAIVYVTPDISFPHKEIEESREELKIKLGETDPPIYWISWRNFVSQVEIQAKINDIPIIIQDVVMLLSDRWGFIYDEIKDWPQYLMFPKLPIFEIIMDWKKIFNYSANGYSEEINWVNYFNLPNSKLFVDKISWPTTINNSNKLWIYNH